MKKFLLMMALAMTMVSCGKGEFSVTATFDDAEMNGKTAFLVNYDTGDTIDSVEVKNKCLRIEGEVENPYFARLVIDKNRLMFIVEKGDIAIDWKKRNAAGTKLNDEFDKISEEADALDSEGLEIETAMKSGKITEAQAEEQSARLTGKMVDFFKKSYTENKKNPIGAWAFVNYAYYGELNAAQLDSALTDAPKDFKELKRIQKAIAGAKQKELTAEGKKFVDFTVKTEDGIDQKFSSFVGNGQYVLVDFWASWCGPCRKEMETLKEIYAKYNGKGLQLLGVAVWDKPQDTTSAMETLQLPWPVIINAQSTPTDVYGITAIPHIILFAPDGTILSRGLQGAKLVKKVDEVMAAKK